MRKTIRKILALLTVLAVFATLGSAAFAEETNTAAAPAQTTAAAATEDSGIIDAAALNQWADSFVAEHQLNGDYQDFSIGFCYTGTGDSWYYNADVWMYSASMYKVPVSMLLAEKVASGEFNQQSTIKGITVEYAESTALVYSNNDSGHAIVDYLGGTYAGKCSDQTEKYTDLPTAYFSQDFIDVSYYTARYMTQVMKTLYDGGEEKFPHVIEYLLQAQPGAYFRLSKKVEDSYQVAQKFGAYEEPNGKNNNHCTAIIYTPTPIIVTVMTRNIMDYQNIIAQVGEHLADYSLELDQKADAWREAEAERAAAEALAAEQATNTQDVELPAAGAENTNGSTGTSSAPAEQVSTVSAAPVLTQNSAADGSSQRKIPVAVIIIAAVLAAVIIAAVILLLVAKKRAAEDEAMYNEELDWTEPEAAVEKRSRRRTADGADEGTRGQTVRKAEPTANTVKKRSAESEYKPKH